MLHQNVSLLTIVALTSCLLPGPKLSADSGIRCVNNCNPTMNAASDPPREMTRITTWEFEIENVNCVCNEDVLISSMLFTNDPVVDGNQISKKGRAELLGFHFPGEIPVQDLEWEMEDETTQTIQFDVETGEDDDGCDFQGFDLRFKVCDTDGGCDWIPDAPCEPPTHSFKPQLSVRAAEVSDAVGVGVINGKVTRVINGQVVGVEASIFILKSSGCVVGAIDSDTPYVNNDIKTDPAWKETRGQYTATGLPFGSYKVRAKMNGSEQVKDVVINSSNSVTIDFAF